MKTVPNLLLVTVLALAACGWSNAFAGPPFVTDDPEPTELGHWEIYNFVAGSHVASTPAVTSGEAGFDINYGGAEDLQLTAVLPLDYIVAAGGKVALGDIELAAKYRFIHQQDGSLMPDVAFFPRVFVPSANMTFGTRRLGLLLPLWAEKDAGPWSIFGGGGYAINPGFEQRNYWQSGIAVQRAIDDELSVGAEIYHQTPSVEGARSFSGFNLGATYKISEHWALLLSAGPGIQNASRGGQYDYYLALEATY